MCASQLRRRNTGLLVFLECFSFAWAIYWKELFHDPSNMYMQHFSGAIAVSRKILRPIAGPFGKIFIGFHDVAYWSPPHRSLHHVKSATQNL